MAAALPALLPKPAGDGGEMSEDRQSNLSCMQCRAKKSKCDRVKPRCGKCGRLSSVCVYPPSRQRRTTNKRNVKELEARLARLEDLFKDNRGSIIPDLQPEAGWTPIPEPFLDNLMRGTADIDSFLSQASMPGNKLLFAEEEFMPNNLIGLNLSEPFPPYPVIEDLTNLYFDRLHPNWPMLQQSRYMMSLTGHTPPPTCLQYSVLALAADISATYAHLAVPFYQRARYYAELDEMKDPGGGFITLAHVQCWALLVKFESQHRWFSRSSLSISRSTRIAQMLNLHCLDTKECLGQAPPPTMPPPTDWCELEERRRAFWEIFCTDRFYSGILGWPSLINSQDIQTLLPASEEAFEQGIEEKASSLADALRLGTSSCSPFAGKVLAAHLFYCNFNRIFKSQPEDDMNDMNDGAYWKSYRNLDNALSTTFMFLPESLRGPCNFQDANARFVNLSLHMSTIYLHRSAVAKIKQQNLPQHLLLQIKARLLSAAQEIINAVKTTFDIDVAFGDPFVTFAVYMAALVFIEDFIETKNYESEDNINFLLNIMSAAGEQNNVTRLFAGQLALDMRRSGIGASAVDKSRHLSLVSVQAPFAGHNGRAEHVQSGPILPHSKPEALESVEQPGHGAMWRSLDELAGIVASRLKIR